MMKQLHNIDNKKVLVISLSPAYDATFYYDKQIELGEVNRSFNEQIEPAGKGVNVAKYFRHFGFDVDITGFLGIENSNGFEHFFMANNIRNHCLKVNGNIRINSKLVEPDGRVTDLNSNGNLDVASNSQRFLEHYTNLIAGYDIIIIAGSLPKTMMSNYYANLVSLAKQKGKQVYLDASGDAMKEAVNMAPDFIKPNIYELAELFEREIVVGEDTTSIADVVSLAKHIMAVKHIRNLVVSLGSRGGVYLLDGEGWYTYPKSPVEVKSTVGAGDSIVAAVCMARLSGFSVEDTVLFASYLSQSAVTCIGPNLPPINVISTFEDNVIMNQLKS